MARSTVPHGVAWAALLPLLAATGCGGGGGGGGGGGAPTPVPFEALDLVANAGNDQKVALPSAGTTDVVLDGASSFFRDSATTTRLPSALEWSFVSGPEALTVDDATSTVASMTLTTSTLPGTYVFALTATEGVLTDVDEVSVSVKAFVLDPIADRIRAGLSHPTRGTVTTTLVAAITGTPSGTVSFTWSGFPTEPFFRNVTGTASSTLVFESPLLSDVEPVPGLPGPIGLWSHAGAIHRITVTATDGVTTDTQHVNVSLGVSTTGLTNVPVNVPVYLNGGDSTSGEWVWQFLAQPASVPAFFGVDNAAVASATTTADQVVGFIPVNPGLYTILVQREAANGTTFAVIDLNAASFVSDGLIGTVAPNPELGHCASCHGGAISFLEDKVTPWSQTLHGRVANDVIDPAGATGEPVLRLEDLAEPLQYVTTGHYGAGSGFTGVNGGFDDAAKAQNVPFHGLDAATFERRYPESARLMQVQCESCHGPGSLHAGDSENIAVTVKVDVCARCHEHEPAEWARSAHAQVVASPSGNSACVRCHTAAGALEDLAVAFRYPDTPPSLTVPSAEGRQNTATCATCHDPHGAQSKFNLRVSGEVNLPGGAPVQAGDAASCVQCHNSRRSFEDAIAGRFSAHTGTQSEMVIGTNGAEFEGFTYFQSPHAIPSQFVTNLGVAGRMCITCHMAPAPDPGDANHDHVGGHTFSVRNESTGDVYLQACTQCHNVTAFTSPRGQEFAFTPADWDGNNVVATSVQGEVAGLMHLLGGAVGTSPTNPFGVTNTPTDANALLVRLAKAIDPGATGIVGASGRIFIAKPGAPSNRISMPATADGDLLFMASWNYLFVIEDKSFGIHNTGYTVGLLQSSVNAIRARFNEAGIPNNKLFQPRF